MPFSGGGALQHTYNTPDHYLVQTASGGLVLGGGIDALEASGEMTPNQTIGVVDDSTTIEVLDKGTPARASLWKLCRSDRPSCLVLSDYCSKNFDDWGPEAHGEG
jgi:hypothetical protein